jgi:hypothetical protein
MRWILMVVLSLLFGRESQAEPLVIVLPITARAYDADTITTNQAGVDVADQAWKLRYDDSVMECSAWRLSLPATGVLAFHVSYAMESVSSGTVTMGLLQGGTFQGFFPALCSSRVPAERGQMGQLDCCIPWAQLDKAEQILQLCRVANNPMDTAQGEMAVYHVTLSAGQADCP